MPKYDQCILDQIFQDEDELEDVLSLGKSIDEALNEISSKGIDASIIFVDVKDYPDGCKLIGRYERHEDGITLALRKKCGDISTKFDIKGTSIEHVVAQIIKIL